jgi:hypothetical protein
VRNYGPSAATDVRVSSVHSLGLGRESDTDIQIDYLAPGQPVYPAGRYVLSINERLPTDVTVGWVDGNGPHEEQRQIQNDHG